MKTNWDFISIGREADEKIKLLITKLINLNITNKKIK